MLTTVYTDNPEGLLSHPSIEAEAPWCRYLENFELTLLLAVPLRGIGAPLTRSDFVKRIEGMPEALIGRRPPTKLYYQRISRTVEDLEKSKIFTWVGGGQRRGCVLTPAGFVTLILNLRALRKDPLVEPAEFEMRREICAAISIMLTTLLGGAVGPGMSRDVHSFFGEVDDVSIAGARVMSGELVVDTTSILRLIARQRMNVQRRVAQLELAAADLERDLGALKDLKVEIPRRLTNDAASARLVSAAVERAQLKLPFLSVQAQRVRYSRYLGYLDDLVSVYTGSLDEVSLADYRLARGK